ncbi:glycosyl transferase family 2 [Caballeronia cordobensis]|uniref:Glycosyl transferase family 2 n=1 Tax=Caballeronia cordobensis TaxID=1353886 RepID=A0A158JKM8_CABCO|nr:glycosyltransferase [Caballeronia cordobensis]SAL69348.1 glycosyl transferase family 2 [Caballeronia cordobensis]
MLGLTVFVTSELFPFTQGGIGRVLTNMLDAHRSTSTEAHGTAVVFLGEPIDASRFAERFPGVLLVDASPATYAERDDGFRYPPAGQYTTHPLHVDSVRAMQALKRLEREHGPLRYVEFPDWGAVAFASVQEKRLGLAFEGATMAVRLHTSGSVLNAMESNPVDRSSLALYDLERKALSDCDVVIGQVSATARAMQTFFDFADDEWLPRLVIDAPPVVLDHGAPASSSIVPGNDTPIAFSSKIQRIKRPDVFVRGCSDFLRKHPEYRGIVHVLAMAPDPVYREEIRRLVPADLAHRFSFQFDADSEARHELIRRSVCVFPNTFESFCLAAYEASLSGALCIVNRSNPAFAEATPWTDDENCVKFDGTPADLSRALTKAFAAGAAVAVARSPAHARPWESIALHEAEPATAVTALPLVSVLVPHHNLGAYLEASVTSALASDHANLQVIVVDDASTDAESVEVVERLAASADPRIRVVRSRQNLGLAATRNLALAHARGMYALTLDADDLIDPRFVFVAVKALERHPEVSFVVPQTAYFDDAPDADPARSPWPQCMTFVGEARASGLLQNRFSTATIMGRIEAFRGLVYDESLSAYEDWDLYMRAVMARRRFIVTNAVHFYYRRRAGSMIHSEAALRRINSYYHEIVRRKEIRIGQNTLPMYIVEGAADSDALALLRAQLAAYENSAVVKAALRARELASRLPKPVQLGFRRVAAFVMKARAGHRAK